MAEAGVGVGNLPMHARAAPDLASLRFLPLAPAVARTIQSCGAKPARCPPAPRACGHT
jgi:hypothetical protein